MSIDPFVRNEFGVIPPQNATHIGRSSMDNIEDTVDYSETTPTLDDWLYAWEAAVASGQSTITRDEAMRRYYERYPESKDYGSNGGIKCDMDEGPCACGAWH